MKKNALINKLSLNKETIAKLNQQEMINIKGGKSPISYYSGICKPIMSAIKMCQKDSNI